MHYSPTMFAHRKAHAVPTDPTAYYSQFWEYTKYHGEEKAREFYGAWSPPVGSINPNAGGQ